MTASRVRLIVDDWNTIRYELLNTRICDLGLRIEGSPIEPLVQRLCRELAAKGLRFVPRFYLTDSWGCPNEVPAIGIPFYLVEKRLSRLEEEQTGEIEDARTIMMLLRHEAGHAINYAYRLWKRRKWAEHFGHFNRPYREFFRPNPVSRRFVRHLVHSVHGQLYAQKHPDEDFAETFAVWLTPRSDWRRKYRYWPVIGKLEYVADVMAKLRDVPPVETSGPLDRPVAEMKLLLAEHYGQRAERYRSLAQGYVDDKLCRIFSKARGRKPSAARLIRRRRTDLAASISRWSGLSDDEVTVILAKLEARAVVLQLAYEPRRSTSTLLDLAALATSLSMDFAYTGRFV